MFNQVKVSREIFTTEIKYSLKVTSPPNSHCKRITNGRHILYDN